ncbi:MAG: homocysteine S-methyltransferase family protein [Veillonellaceae bacterium]|nr:homocysteine S-methyltransferase family protein [Veillonellaceae bacterium]
MQIFDGAMGTMLQQAGLKEGDCPELFTIEHADVVQKIHESYLQAGSTIITTNTFGASGLKLEDYGLSDRVKEINTAAVKVAKAAIAAVKPSAKVAGDMGPTGKFIAPLGNVPFKDIYDTYKEQALALVEAGVNYLIIETIIDIQEMRAALLAAKDARQELGKTKDDVKIICQFSFSEDGRTITGTPPEVGAILLEAMGADIVGINCSLGPEQLVPLIAKIASVTNLPISAQPNAGMPVLVGKETIFPLKPDDMAKFVPALMDAGASYLGACCGSTPAHIEAIAKAAQVHEPKVRQEIAPFTAITSRTKVVKLGHTEKPLIIGERINPTGRKKLAAEIKGGSFVMVKRDALQQVEAGAQILDVNMGVAGMSQVPLMEKAVMELSMLVETPLSIDTLDPEALEVGLQAYPGRPLINSVNAEPEQMEKVIPLAKRYGAALLCLPLNSGNLPEKAEDRVAVAKTIVEAAYKEGLRPQDLLLDPLVLTLASGDQSARETLRTLRLYKKEFGFPTVMGLSNISFGLPQRPYLNAQFLTMALEAGLTTPIMNPLNDTVKKAFVSGCTLLGFDPGAAEFINDYGYDEEVKTVKKKGPQGDAFSSDDPLENIKHAVEQGEKEIVVDLVKKALADGTDPMLITKKALSDAMSEVGVKFGAGKVFLPQVMLAAEAMQGAFQTIKEVLPDSGDVQKDTIVLATVKGDIHDLGKNIVSALLENNGYRIVDLGKDVSPEEIVKAAKDNKASVIGIASLMTTTMPMIDETIKAVRQSGLSSKVLVGGAVLSQEYADKAGADSYAKDGISAVNVVKKLLGE